MSKVTMLNMAGQEAGQIELKDEIFGIEPNQNAVHAVVKNILANRRQGTQSAKTRAEVISAFNNLVSFYDFHFL